MRTRWIGVVVAGVSAAVLASLLLEGKVAAVTALRASPTCAGPGWKTRLDTEGVQGFPADVLTTVG